MKILMYTHNLDKKNGGVTFALKMRAEALHSLNYDLHVLTHGFNLNPQLESTGYRIQNIFDYYADKQKGQTIEENIYYEDEILYKDSGSKVNNYRVFSKGEYKQYRQYDSHGEIKVIDEFTTPWTRKRKLLYKDGKLKKIIYMNIDNKPKFAKYIENDQCFISSVIDPKTWKDVIIYNHTDNIESKIYDFQFNFLTNYILDNKIEIIFIDKREDAILFLKIKELYPHLKLIFVLHSNHYADYVNNIGLHKTLNPIFHNLNKFHKVIILTKSQQENIINEYGNKDKFNTLSNIINFRNLNNIATSRKNLISIGRYEDVKNMSNIIEVFKLVSKKIPDVRLDLYGYGKEKQALKSLAKGEEIFIHEFTEKPWEIMQKSSAFIFTSKYEGQPLVLLECYDTKCPVFSFDINFGPKDVITNYENGLIIKNRNIKQMAREIIAYMNHEYDFEFSKRCSDVFSKNRYIKELIEILND